MQDPERGVVWEEALVLLPRNSRAAFLSATAPNAAEFAEWVAATHGTRCHVVSTDFRPVPLQHYIMPCGSGDAALYLTVRARPIMSTLVPAGRLMVAWHQSTLCAAPRRPRCAT